MLGLRGELFGMALLLWTFGGPNPALALDGHLWIDPPVDLLSPAHGHATTVQTTVNALGSAAGVQPSGDARTSASPNPRVDWSVAQTRKSKRLATTRRKAKG